MNIFNHKVRPILFSEIVVDAWDGRVAERSQQISFALKVLYDSLPDERVWRGIDHLFDRNQFDNIRKMQIAGTVHRPHPANTDYILDQVTL